MKKNLLEILKYTSFIILGVFICEFFTRDQKKSKIESILEIIEVINSLKDFLYKCAVFKPLAIIVISVAESVINIEVNISKACSFSLQNLTING